MARVSEDLIRRAKSPWEIFSRDPTLMEKEKEEYLERFKLQKYKKIENFIIQQQIILLYRQGLEELDGSTQIGDHTLVVTDVDGKEYHFHYQYLQNQVVCQMLTTKDHVILIVPKRFKSYYENYTEKCQFKLHVNRGLWENVKYMLPEVMKSFETIDGDFVIIIKKPHSKVYPMSSILDYFDGKIAPEYVSSILTRLYSLELYLNLRGISHNALTVDNLFFSPGRFTNPGDPFNIEDVRIVGVYGGWFFSTNNDSSITGKPNDKIVGLPKRIKDIIPKEVADYHYGSYKVDVLAIKQIGRELLGDITGRHLEDVPKPFVDWLNCNSVAPNALEEMQAWEKIRSSSFSRHLFVEMDLS